MPKPRWSDFGSIWKTIREVDINAIRHEAERPLAIVCVGQPAALWWVDRLLRDGPNRYPLARDPLALVPLAEAGDYLDLLPTADLLILALDAAAPLGEAEVAGLDRLSKARRQGQIVLLFGQSLDASTPWSTYLDRGAATLVDPQSPSAGAVLGGAVMHTLPANARLVAARHLPGLRPLYASRLTGEVSVSAAAVAIASGVPSMVPILGLPFAAADTIILTKNQALMVYRLALACGAAPDFQKRMMEITPVIGGAVVWRQIAGALVGLVPAYGIVPKTAVAFGGTYVVGLAATRWYETGLLTAEERKRIVAEASAKARVAATAMVEQARVAGGKAGAQAQDGWKKASQQAAAAGAQATAAAKTQARVMVDGARATTAKAGARARGTAQRLRESGRKAVRRQPKGVTDGFWDTPSAGDAAGQPSSGAPVAPGPRSAPAARPSSAPVAPPPTAAPVAPPPDGPADG